MRVVDLGSGSGSNARFLAPRLGAGQQWLLVDHDPALLAVASGSVPVPADTRLHDLHALTADLFAGRALVTASALLDLVSEPWLATLAGLCRAAGAHVLFVLNYDGRIECDPRDPDDDRVRDLVNTHQRGDKGFGPALGPDSGARAEALLAEVGYAVVRERSDWVLGPDEAELQRQLIAGWAHAADEIAPAESARIAAWAQRRLALVDQGRSRLVVGHDDVAGVIGPRPD